jgi:SAM-dependent methyltransferase
MASIPMPTSARPPATIARAGTRSPSWAGWGIGRYERFAPDLEPAAEHVVALAELQPGERVLDLGCGTGNAALLAARAGAVVTGLDPASRLLEIARGRLDADGREGSFVVGDAQALPFREGEFDAVLSVFGVIFAADAERAMSEAIRVANPAGRVLISVWLPGGGVDAMTEVLVTAIGSALGREIPRFPWHDQAAVAQLAAKFDASVGSYESEVVFSRSAPEAYLHDQETQHPMAIAARGLLQRAGTYDTVRARMLEALRRGNGDGSFRMTSRYRVIELRRQ